MKYTHLNGQYFLSNIEYLDGTKEAKNILFRRESDFYDYIETFAKKNPNCDGIRYYKNPNMKEDGSIKTADGFLYPNEIV